MSDKRFETDEGLFEEGDHFAASRIKEKVE